MAHELPNLPYSYDALEPYIDAKTMEIHQGKHHAGYVNDLNKALEGHRDLQGKPVEQLLTGLAALPESIREAVRNNGGGHHNHSLFWKIMKKGGGEPKGKLADAIQGAFGSFDQFKKDFAQAALRRFGSGWAWLSLADGKLLVESTANQDNPVASGRIPILGIDVWEHAYYLHYQNRRNEYVEAWWNVVNWEQVTENYLQLAK